MRYVPQEILDAYAECYGVTSNDLIKFAGGEDWNDGTIYQYPHGGNVYLLKVMEMTAGSSDDQMRLDERLDYLFYLGERQAPIIHPVLSANKHLVERVSWEKYHFQAYAWKKVEGEFQQGEDPRELTQFYQNWGAALGRIHALAKQYPSWRESANQDAQGQPLIYWENEIRFFRNWLNDEEVRAVWDELHAILLTREINRENFGFIHNDPHHGNILVSKKGLVLLDFDVANYHWFMIDVGIMFFSEINRLSRSKPLPLETRQFIIDKLLCGYASQNTLPSSELDQLELFVLYRRILSFCVFYEYLEQHNPIVLGQVKKSIIERIPLLH